MISVFYLSEVLIVLVPVLMTIAFVTIAERKVMAAMQRRCGPNAVGVWGVLQPFADALKLLVKEIIRPRHSNSMLFVLGPCITLTFALLGWAIIPFGEGLSIFDFELGIFFALAVSSLGGYGILISGWSANSKYAFLGAIRATAQLLSYELVFSSIVLILILFSGSFSLTYIVECQQAVWNIFPLMPIALAFFIAILAETNRPPFDLAEAESELVAGFMTEHSASIFVFFFLGEYSSLIIMSAFMVIFFLGGYHCPNLHSLVLNPIEDIYYLFHDFLIGDNYAENIVINHTKYNINSDVMWSFLNNDIYCNANLMTDSHLLYSLDIKPKMDLLTVDTRFYQSMSILIDRIYGSYIFGLKIVTVVFFFIWVRASFPRLRYDQLMSLCWKELLPLVFGYIIFSISIFSTFDMIPYGTGF